MSDDVYTNKLRIFRALKTYKHEEAAGDVVSVSQDNKAKVVFESNGVYAIQCFREGVELKASFLHVDDKYVNGRHKVLKVGHPRSLLLLCTIKKGREPLFFICFCRVGRWRSFRRFALSLTTLLMSLLIGRPLNCFLFLLARLVTSGRLLGWLLRTCVFQCGPRGPKTPQHCLQLPPSRLRQKQKSRTSRSLLFATNSAR